MSENQSQGLVPVSTPFLQEIATLHDIPMRVTVEAGRLKLSVKEFLRLAPESVLDLKKPSGEPFEIAINGLVVARGEVIVVEQSSGVRIVELIKPSVTA